MKHLPPLKAKTIQHKAQRYPTVGDYQETRRCVTFTVSRTNPDYEFLVLIHELVEWFLVKRHDVALEDIDAFDKRFEENRVKGDVREPGNDENAPYFVEHMAATEVEKHVADVLGIDWDSYDKSLNAL